MPANEQSDHPTSDTHTNQPVKAGLAVRLAFYCGQLGWSVASFGVMNLLFYFFDANTVDGERMFPALIPGIGLLALIAGLSRLFDAITDPIIASMSDRSRSRFGRRRLFMAIGGLPFILLSVLVFVPVTPDVSWLNGAWLTVSVLLFYLFMTVYITPYFALIAELGHDAAGRLKLSTGVAISWAAGFMIGNTIYVLQGLFESAGFSSLHALQLSVGVFALVSLILVYIPVLVIDEKKYCYPHTSDQSTWAAVKSCFSNRNFRTFVGADFVYFIAMTFIQTGISYYIIMLLGLEKEQATTFMLSLFLISFLLYGPIGHLAGKVGKKRVVLASFFMMALGVGFMSLWGIVALPANLVMVISLVLMIFPVSAFGFLFYAILGDIAEADGRQTGHYKEGMFYGTRTFMSKTGTAVTLSIFPLISHIGDNGSGSITETGIRLTLLFALLTLALGMFLFSRYDEKDVEQTLLTTDPGRLATAS